MDQYLLSGQLNSDSIIVAHSLGTHFIPKYLAQKNISVKLYISCAGFINDNSGREDLQEVVNDFKPDDEEINKVVKLIEHRYSIYSNDDHMNPQEELEYYADRFQAEKVFISNVGHLGKRSGIKELPEAVDIIKKILEK